MSSLPPGGGDELTYGSVPLAPVIFQDDILHGTEGIKEARIANIKMDRVVKRLNLTLNEKKLFALQWVQKNKDYNSEQSYTKILYFVVV